MNIVANQKVLTISEGPISEIGRANPGAAFCRCLPEHVFPRPIRVWPGFGPGLARVWPAAETKGPGKLLHTVALMDPAHSNRSQWCARPNHSFSRALNPGQRCGHCCLLLGSSTAITLPTCSLLFRVRAQSAVPMPWCPWGG